MKSTSRAMTYLLGALAAAVLIASSNLAAAQTKLFKSGNQEEAVAYYGRISTSLNFQVDQSSLSDLLSYLGYGDLSAENIELGVASDFADLPIVTSRYLAPRMVDISGAPPYQAGWRKLVRLLAQPGSGAERAGIASAYIQFDYLRAQDDPEPYPVASASQDGEPSFIQGLLNSLWAQDESDASSTSGAGNGRMAHSIQVILVPTAGQDAHIDGAYFMLFQGASAGYASTISVAANFDLPPDPKSDGVFYVPSACGRCHGDVGRPTKEGLVFESGRLNFLDTDYWHDRIQPEDYFGEAGSLHGALFDGGPDPSSDQFTAAFETIRVLNTEIADQIERTPTVSNDPEYQRQGVQKWIELHSDSTEYAPPLKRALGDAEDRWSEDNPGDGPLLTSLSRHCYRCHNTIDFNVFLKPRFAGVAKSSISSVMFGIMPFGHPLMEHRPEEADAMIEGFKKLLAQQTLR